MARSMRVLIFVVVEMASSEMPRSSRCLRSFSPNEPTPDPGRQVTSKARIETPIIIGEGDGGCQRRVHETIYRSKVPNS